MGVKDMCVYVQKEGEGKKAYFVDPADTIAELKTQILNSTYCHMPTKKSMVRPERDKLLLTLNGEVLPKEDVTLGDASISGNALLMLSLKEPLSGSMQKDKE